jgi:hypothetical protein
MPSPDFDPAILAEVAERMTVHRGPRCRAARMIDLLADSGDERAAATFRHLMAVSVREASHEAVSAALTARVAGLDGGEAVSPQNVLHHRGTGTRRCKCNG